MPMDTSSLSIPNLLHIAPNEYVGGFVSPESLSEVAALGFTHIIDMLPEHEHGAFDEAAMAAELGLYYVHLPIVGGHDLNRSNAEALDALLDGGVGSRDGLLNRFLAGREVAVFVCGGSGRLIQRGGALAQTVCRLLGTGQGGRGFGQGFLRPGRIPSDIKTGLEAAHIILRISAKAPCSMVLMSPHMSASTVRPASCSPDWAAV